MIYTVTLNPTLDKTVIVKKIVPNESIKVISEERYAGGKGINVSRAIKSLGGESIALGFLGGYTGLEVEGRLLNEGITTAFVFISEETRTNVIVHSEEDKRELRFNFAGPKIKPYELASFIEKCRHLHPRPSFVVISGSIPEGVEPIIYTKLIEIFESRGAKVILDTSGEPLKKGLLGTPFMVKPNKVELEEFTGRKIHNLTDAVKSAEQLLEYVEVAVVSLGEQGLICATRSEIYHVIPPKVKAVNTVGAGDCTVAGMVLALQRKLPIEEVLRWGSSAGTASTLTSGSATIAKSDFEEILKNVKVKKLGL